MIRAAQPDDAPALTACAQAAFARYVARIGRDPAPMHTDFATAIARAEVHVASAGADILGYAICRVEGRDMLLDTVAVWPQHAGQGVGKHLIAHVESLARAVGCRAVTLYTNAQMTENLPFYAALGYSQIDRRLQDGFDRVFFRKLLS